MVRYFFLKTSYFIYELKNIFGPKQIICVFNHFNPGLFTCHEKIMTNPRIFQVECNEISLDLRECNKNRKNSDRDIYLETTNEINGLNSQNSRNDNLNLFRNSEDDFVELESANLNLAVTISAGSGISKSNAHKTVGSSAVRHSEDIKVKKKIPGPAGTLPKLKEGQNINENLIQQVNSKAKKGNHKDSINASQLSQVNSEHSLQNRTWSCAISDLDSRCPALFNVLNRFSLASVPKRVKMKTLPSCKVPIICASITSITLHNIDASVVLKDPSGSMPGALHREIVKEYGDSIYVGTVLVLKKVGVFSPALGRNCYLNITPNNLVRIYTRKVIGSQENSDSIIKVQDSDFSELAAFSENIMRLPDVSCPSSCLTSPIPVSIESNPFHQSKISNPSNLARHNLPLSVHSKGNMVSPVGVKKPEYEMGGMPNESQELLDDWIDDEEFVLAASQQEKHELLISQTDLRKADCFHQDDTETFQKPTNSKPKATSMFAIESNDDFVLSFEPSSSKNRDFNQSTLSAKRVQHQEDSFEASKKPKFSTPKKPTLFPPVEIGLMKSSLTSQCTKISVNSSPHLPSQPINISQPAKSNFKFKSVTHSVSSNLSSQSLFSQGLKSDSQLNAASCKNLGQNQSSTSNHTSDGESLEKLLEGLTDEMLDDF